MLNKIFKQLANLGIVATLGSLLLACGSGSNSSDNGGNNSTASKAASIQSSDSYHQLAVQNADSGYTYLKTYASPDVGEGNSYCGQYGSVSACYGQLTPFASQWITLLSDSAWVQLDYDVCNGTDDNAINYDGATPKCTTYMGHFGVNLTATMTTINDLDNGTAVLGPYTNGSFTVNFTSNSLIPTYNYPTTPSSYSTQQYRGVNLAGGEYDYAFQLPSVSDGAFYAQSGMNTIRLPFKWEYMQSSSTNTQDKVDDPSVAINFSNPNAKAYADLVQQYLDKGMVVILDMHNYMRYGTNQAIIGSGTAGSPSAQQYAAAWVQIGTQFKNNPHVIFDLMNEPNTMSTQLVLDNYNAVIPALRFAGINNQVLLEGNGWSGAWSWTSSSYDTATPQKSNASVFVPSVIQDSANNYAINVHQYFDSNYSGTSNTCIANSVPDISGLTSYLATYGLQAMITELGGANTQDCADDINKFLSTLPNNYIGWTGWVGGQNGISQLNYFGVLSDGSQTITMTSGFQPNLTISAQ